MKGRPTLGWGRASRSAAPHVSPVSSAGLGLEATIHCYDLYVYCTVQCEEVARMCVAVECPKCGKTTWSGCGAHVDRVMKNVPESERCTCATSGTRSSEQSC